MKIRTDYVSNSSSSSFVIFGKRRKRITIDDLEKLKDGENYLLVLPKVGNDGDYIFPINLDLLYECDLHFLDLNEFKNALIIKAKYFDIDGSIVPASVFKNGDWKEISDFRDSEIGKAFDSQTKSNGISLAGCSLFSFWKDNENPSLMYEKIDGIKTFRKYHEDKRRKRK